METDEAIIIVKQGVDNVYEGGIFWQLKLESDIPVPNAVQNL